MAPRMIVFLVALYAAVASAAVTLDANGCVVNYDGTSNLFPTTSRLVASDGSTPATTVLFPSDFTVTYTNAYKYVVNTRTGQSFLLYQCGTTAPVLSSLPYPSTTQVFAVPLKSVATSLTVTLNFMEKLGLRSKVTLLGSYVVSACMQKLVACTPSAIGSWSVPYGGPAPASLSTVDAVLTDSFGTGASGTAKDIAFDASTAPGDLERAEWVKFLSVFFNAEATANTIFNAVTAPAFTSLAASASAAGTSPVVAWVSYSSYGGVSSWVLSAAAYKLAFTAAAGASSPAALASATADITYTSAAALKAALVGVTILVDETYTVDPKSYSLATFTSAFGFVASDATAGSSYPFLTNGIVLREDKRLAGANCSTCVGAACGYTTCSWDWFESALPSPQVVLADLVAYTHPSLKTGYSPVYLRNLAAGEAVTYVTAAACTDQTVLCPGQSLAKSGAAPAATGAAVTAAAVAALLLLC